MGAVLGQTHDEDTVGWIVLGYAVGAGVCDGALVRSCGGTGGCGGSGVCKDLRPVEEGLFIATLRLVFGGIILVVIALMMG